MPTYNYNQLLKERTYVSLSSLSASFSSSVTSTASSLLNSRLKISNLLNTDIILPIDIRNLSETIYFGNAYLRTKEALYKIINEYPIGLSGSTTANLYLEDIEKAQNFISTLSEYEWWVMRQLCGASITSSSLSFTATATAVRESLSGTITSSSPTFPLPVVVRSSGDNLLLPPQGVYNMVKLDSYYTDLLDQDMNRSLVEAYNLTPYEQILITAIAFDQGIQNTFKGWSGTGSSEFVFKTYDGVTKSRIIPDIFKESVNRSMKMTDLVPGVLKNDDELAIMDRTLNSMADMFDGIKVYVDGLQHLFKNHWGNWDKLPKGYIQQLIAHQYGIELFSSENKVIKDDFRLRGEYKTQKELTFEFWNRILCSLVYILKTKGTIESIKATSRAYGFSPGFLQIYELASYKALSDTYNNETRNYSSAKFAPTTTNNKRVFNSVSAATSVSYVSLMAHAQIKFDTDIYRGAATGQNGVICNFAPSGMHVSYKYTYDTQNIATSGFPYIQFVVSVSGQSLSTSYNFVKAAQTLYPNEPWNLFFGRDSNQIYASIGFIPSNTTYFDPILSSSTASLSGSISASTHSFSAIQLGSNTNTPNFTVSQFNSLKIGNNESYKRNIILDPTYNSSPSGFNSIIALWKLNEFVTLANSGENYILDAGPSAITGSPTIIGSVGKPYTYNFDMPAFFSDNIPGFKIQQPAYTNSSSSITQSINQEKAVRVGVSLAAPLNTYIHTIFGSRLGELFAEPNNIFSATGAEEAVVTYDTINTKINELYSVIGANENQIQISEYLKFINRINGHLGSFFEFIEQVIPTSKRLIEKGLIIENPYFNRTILKKTNIEVDTNLKDEVSINNTLTGSTEADLVKFVNIASSLSAVSDNNNYDGTGFGVLTARINNSFTSSGEFQSSNNQNMTFDSTENLSMSAEGSFSEVMNASVTGSMRISGDMNTVHSGTASLGYSHYTIFDGEAPTMEYYPHSQLRKMSTTYFNIGTQKLIQKNNYLNDLSQASIGIEAYLLNAALDKENQVIRTSLTASTEEKKLTGIVFITDVTGRKISTAYPSIEIDMRECMIDNLNRVRVIMDGEDLPFTQQKKQYPIKSKKGIEFEIRVTGAPNDGIASNTSVRILFNNLLNKTDKGISVPFILADSAQAFSRTTGTGIKKGT